MLQFKLGIIIEYLKNSKIIGVSCLLQLVSKLKKYFFKNLYIT